MKLYASGGVTAWERSTIGAGIRYDPKDDRLAGWTIHRDRLTAPGVYQLRYRMAKFTEHRTLAVAVKRAEEAVGIERVPCPVPRAGGEEESQTGWGGREVPEIFR